MTLIFQYKQQALIHSNHSKEHMPRFCYHRRDRNIMVHFTQKITREKSRCLAVNSYFWPLFPLLFLLLITSTSFASDDATRSNTPDSVIKTTLQKITTFSNNAKNVDINEIKNSNHIKQLRQFIEQQIIPNFDFDNMSHWITGRYGNNMSEQDKADFKRSLRETFLSSLAKHLGDFDAKNTRIKLHRPRYRGKEEAFVSTTIYRPDRVTIRLDFRMHRIDKNWKIIDIKANGISAVLYYRRHFISQLRQYQDQHQNQHQNLNNNPNQYRY